MSEVYSPEFYREQSGGSRASAAAIVPILVKLFKPRSVLDVGCGAGTWCDAFVRAGVPRVVGVDGPWAQNFAVDGAAFIACDFESGSLPALGERFDLAISLEFLEHINGAMAPKLVSLLAKAADTVIAGAAIPGQGGAHHVNEQWPQYWRALFDQEGMQAVDCLRPLFWDMASVEPWYAQNMIGYFRHAPPAEALTEAREAFERRMFAPAAVVHPEMFRRVVDPCERSLVSHIAGALVKARTKFAPPRIAPPLRL